MHQRSILNPAAGADFRYVNSESKHIQADGQDQTTTPNTVQFPPFESPGHMASDNQMYRGWRKVVRNFTLSWFTVTMGTGIVSILLHELPYNGRWLYLLSVITFCLNIALFASASLISLLRYTIWPELWTETINHPNQSLFVGAVPVVKETFQCQCVFY